MGEDTQYSIYSFSLPAVWKNKETGNNDQIGYLNLDFR